MEDAPARRAAVGDICVLIAPPQPLLALTEDEILFRDNIRQFADQALRPKVREMDEKGVFDAELIEQFFEIGDKAE